MGGLNAVGIMLSQMFTVGILGCAITTIAFCAFLLISEEINIAPDGFETWCVAGLILSLGLMALMGLNCIATRLQPKKGIKSLWNGKRLLLITNFLSTAVLILLIFVFFNFRTARNSLKNTKQNLLDDPNAAIPLDINEVAVATKLNKFFFEAIIACTYTWIWDIIDDNCKYVLRSSILKLQQVQCVRTECLATAQEFCAATVEGCSGSETKFCPYQLCRQGMIDYMLNATSALYLFLTMFVVCLGINYVLNFFLACFNAKDSFADILRKNGTLKVHKRMKPSEIARQKKLETEKNRSPHKLEEAQPLLTGDIELIEKGEHLKHGQQHQHQRQHHNNHHHNGHHDRDRGHAHGHRDRRDPYRDDRRHSDRYDRRDSDSFDSRDDYERDRRQSRHHGRKRYEKV
jgi:hypothetical protein